LSGADLSFEVLDDVRDMRRHNGKQRCNVIDGFLLPRRSFGPLLCQFVPIFDEIVDMFFDQIQLLTVSSPV